MYLKNIVIKNIGPIDELSIELPFKGDFPKPIIFVGENGTGKTILESQIIDGFYEIGSSLFDDVGIKDGLQQKYYKISGGTNLQTGKNSGFSLLKFIDNKNKTLEYFDKVGNVNKQDFEEFIHDFSLDTDNKNSNQKAITNIGETIKENLRNEWLSGVHFYQPAYRYEEPFWKNDAFTDQSRFEDKARFRGQLNKEIEIIASAKDNKSFLMDLVLDFVIRQDNPFDQTTWNNINDILIQIKKEPNIRFGIGPRGGHRVSIMRNEPDELLLPSIDNLSLGESILLNLFINIIRHGDTPPKPIDQIQGIVAIDEIDAHLHTNLQNDALPKLIKMFPKIQFIITTHSPLFLLGMKNTFEEDDFEIRNMPKGELIKTERFSEFEDAYIALKQTEKFEDDIKARVVENTKPIVYVEGPTDVKYIKKAFQLYGKDLENLDIEMIGENTTVGTKNSNNKALKNAGNTFSTNLNLFKQKVILLHDPEESVTDEEYQDILYIRKMPQFDNSFLKKGIESLFDTSFIDGVMEQNIDCFEYHKLGNVKKNHKIISNQKQAICDWICDNGEKTDFKNFEKIFKIIEDILEIKTEIL